VSTQILVTGGTGTVGRLVAARLRDKGRDVRVLSRGRHQPVDGVEHVRGDLNTGEGVDAAVAGADTVVHCAGGAKGDDDKARNLVRAASRAGSPHLVHISVVGVDRIPLEGRIDRAMFGYFGAKLAAERAVADSGLPHTIVRATQLHELMFKAAQAMTKLPVLPAPAGFRFQPIDGAEVAQRLVELALDEPAGLVPDLGGPRIYPFADLLRSYLRAAGKRRPTVSIPLPGKAAAAYRAGANLTPEHAVGHRTWEDFLADRLGS
jgi:uncharacterized protein YbjT (DUF2867 family)